MTASATQATADAERALKARRCTLSPRSTRVSYAGKKYEDWELDDPAGQDLETVRRIDDELDQRIQKLIAELLPDEAASSS